MTHAEFDTWREYHCAAFPGMKGWFCNQDSQEGKHGDQIQTLQHWYRCLCTVDPKDAQRSTDAMNCGEEESGPFGKHPQIVRRLCESYVRRRTPTPSTTYHPPACHTPDLHRDYAEQLDEWLAKTDDERRTEAVRVHGEAFRIQRTIERELCSVCDRIHGNNVFLIVLFDATAAATQPATGEAGR